MAQRQGFGSRVEMPKPLARYESRDIGWHHLSDATCLIRPHLFHVLRVVSSHLQHDSPHANNIYIRQIVTCDATYIIIIIIVIW